MRDKDIMKMSKSKLEKIKNYLPEVPFYGIVIVPMNDIHDSGFRCMKFILLDEFMNIVGAVGGGSDVIHINGIGGYGKKFGSEKKGYGWRIDCLPESGCLRLFNDVALELDDFIGSDFQFFVKE